MFIDNFEAAEWTKPESVRVGDRIAVTGTIAHTVVGISRAQDGSPVWYLTLKNSNGKEYEARRSTKPLPVVKP